MLSYSGDQSNAAYIGYEAEYERIYGELQTEGVIDTEGKVLSDALVNYIELPDLVASGGNVYVQTDNFYGKGSVRAEGSPTASITNNTTLATNVGNITVGDSGGVIYYRGVAMDTGKGESESEISAALRESIKLANKTSSYTVANPYAAKGKSSQVHITGNNSLGGITYRYNDQDIATPVKADIIINGNIYADKGTVTVESKQNDILIEGKTANDEAGIVASSVSLVAGNGSISQGCTDGIINVGGDPQEQYTYDKSELTANTTNNMGASIKTASKSNIAGKNIYINATDVNINGAIQSGFEKYFAEIKPETKLNSDYSVDSSNRATFTVDQRMREIADTYPQSGIDNSAVVGNPSFLLIKGGTEYNETTKCYDYRVDVYYNPATGEIVIPDVESGGGTVSVVGRISSTGSGSIRALDGTSDISVKSTVTDKTLRVGKLVTNDVTGRITLTDTARGLRTEYTRDDTGTMQVKTTDLKGEVASEDATALSVDGKTAKYNPLSGLRYNWTTGDVEAETKTYRKIWYNDMWGWSWATSVKDVSQSLIKEESETTQISTGGKSTSALRNGAYVGKAKGANNDDQFDVIYTQKEDYSTRNVTNERHWSQGIFGCHKYTELTWDTKTGKTNIYVASVKADNPIDIGFIGQADGNSTVQVTANSDVILAGDLGNKTLYSTYTGSDTAYSQKGKVDISSTNGTITGTGGSIYADEATVSSYGSMENLSFTAGDEMKLTLGIEGQDQLAEREIIGTQIKSNREAKGNVVLKGTGSDNTDLIEITNSGNEGNITTADGATIKARRIDLASDNGAIKATVKGGDTPLGSDTMSASVNATAKGDIELTQKTGDIRVGRVYSSEGNVTLNVPGGSLVDALDYRSQGVDNEGVLLGKWLSAGLISPKEGESAAEGSVTQAEKTAFLRKLDKAQQTAKGDEQSEEEAEAISYEEWDRDLLLYSIQESIVNQTSKTLPKTSTKDPNVKGNNITLNVKENAGLNSSNSTTMKISTLGDATQTGASAGTTGLDDLKLLSRADASTVIWDKDNDKITISKVLPIGVQLNEANEGAVQGSITVKGYEDNTSLAEGNAYLEGRTDADGTGLKDLYIKDISVKGNAMVHSLGGIYNAADPNNVTITAASLDLTAANGSIGTAEKALRTNITGVYQNAGDLAGTLRAVSTDGIYILNDNGVDGDEQKDLYIRAMSSGGDIVLTSKGSIYSAKSTSDVDGVIQVEDDDKTITVTSKNGDIGSVQKDDNGNVVNDKEGMPTLGDTALRIRDNAKEVNLSAKNVYVNVPTRADGTAGTLNVSINEAELQNLAIKSAGTINILNDGALSATDTISLDTAKALTVDKNLTAGEAIKLRSGEDLAINSELKAENSSGEKGDILLIAGGSLTEGENGKLDAEALKAKAGESIALTNAANTLAKATLDSPESSLATTGGVEVTFVNSQVEDGKLTGAAEVHNYGSGDITLGGDVSSAKTVTIENEGGGFKNVAQEGVSTAHNVIADEGISIKVKGNLQNEGALTSESGGIALESTEGRVTNTGTITSEKESVLITAAKELANSGAVTAAKEVRLDSEKNIKNTGELTSKSADVALDAGTMLENSGALNAATSVTLDAEQGINNSGAATGESISFYAGTDLTNTGALNAVADVTLDAGQAINNGGTVTSADGDVSFTAASGIINSGAVDSEDGTVTLKTDAGAVTLSEGGDLTAGKDVIVTGDSFLNGSESAKGATLTSGNDILVITTGNLINYGDMDADGDISLAVTEKGTLTLGSISEDEVTDITAGGAVNIENAGGAVINGGGKKTGADIIGLDDVSVTATGDIRNSGAIGSLGDVTLTVTEDGVIENSVGGDIVAFGGNITLINEGSAGDGYNVQNAGDLVTFGGKIKLESEHGSISNDVALGTGKYDGVFGDELEGNEEYTNGMAFSVGSIELLAENGSIKNTQDLVAYGGDETDEAYVKLVAKDGITSEGYNVYARDDISITSKEGNITNKAVLESLQGDVKLTAEKGSIENVDGADIATMGGSVELTAKGDITNTGDLIAIDANAEGNEAAGTIKLVSTKGDIKNTDVFSKSTVGTGANASTTEDYKANDGKTYDVATQNIYLSARNGSVTNEHELVALGDVTLEAKTGLDNFSQTVYAGGDITLTATDGALVNKAELYSVEGNVNLNAEQGTVVNALGAKVIAENGSVTMTAGGAASSEVKYIDVSSGSTGTVTMSGVSDGVLVTEKFYKDTDGSYKQIGAETEVSKLSKANIVTVFSYLDSSGNKVYPADTSVTDAAGKAVPMVEITTADGTTLKGIAADAEAYHEGDVINRGDVVALGEGGINLISENSNVENYDTFDKVDGEGEFTRKGDYYFNDGTKYDKDKTFYFDGTGHELVSVGDISLNAENGYVYNGLAITTDGTFNAVSGKDLTSGVNFGDITAGKDVNIVSTGGNVNLTKEAQISAGKDANIIASGGSVTLTEAAKISAGDNIIVAGKKDVNIENGGSLATGGSLSIAADDGSVKAAGTDFNVKNGSLAITSASGDVEVGSAQASGVVAVGAGVGTNGEKAQRVVVGKLSGDQVVFFNDSVLDGAALKADTIEARDSLVLRGDEISVGSVTRGGATGTLNAVVTGAGGGLVKKDLSLDMAGDVRFNELALTTGSVRVDNGTLRVDNLRVGERAELTALGFKNMVYGVPMQNEGAPAVFFTNGKGRGFFDLDLAGMAYSEQSRAAELSGLSSALSSLRVAGFGEATGAGLMNLYIYAPGRELSNGMLLNILPGYHVESQRSAGLINADMKATYPYYSYFDEKPFHFYRYNLYEVPVYGMGMSFMQDAAEEEESSEA